MPAYVHVLAHLAPTPALKGNLQRQLFQLKRKKQRQDAEDAEAARLLAE
jgi:hypothetical protein